MLLDLKLIRIDGDTQSRERVNVDTINEYVESSKEGAIFPPLETFYDGVHYYLVDGFHRYFMYQKLGVEKIEAIVKNGTIRDAQLYSFGVNDKHGLQRSNSDKRKIILRIVNDIEWAEFSNREIAKKCNISHAFVNKVKKELEKDKQEVKIPVLVEEEYDPQEDDIKELISVNQKLLEENQELKAKEIVLSGDEEKVLNEIEVLQKRIKLLESELNVVKSSRDQFQNKNAELIKEVTYWRNRCKKLEK